MSALDVKVKVVTVRDQLRKTIQVEDDTGSRFMPNPLVRYKLLPTMTLLI